MPDLLKVKNLSVAVDGKPIIHGINLSVGSGGVHVVMGPNGSGKTSLALSLMGHPSYQVINGQATMLGSSLLSLKPEERAKKGLFLSFQNPVSVPGVTLGQLIWSSYKNLSSTEIDVRDFYTQVKKQARDLGLKEEMLERFINDGFSGGEKKKAEMLLLLTLNLQHPMLQVKVVIFDEIDSGLDVDTLKKIAKVINQLVKKGSGIILITHNQKILKYVKPDFVHILKEGRIVKSGNFKLAHEIEKKGYARF